MSSNDNNLINLIYTAVKWRKFIIINFFIVCAVASIISLVVPQQYTARTRIVPPTGDSSLLGMGLSGLMGSLPFSGIGNLAAGINPQTASFLGILKSRSMKDTIIEHFDLVKVYGSDDVEKAIEELIERTELNVTEEGIIELGILDKKPQRAADIANMFVYKLNERLTYFSTMQARYNREFIEKRLDLNKRELAQAELELKDFQERYKAISIPNQTLALINNAADIKAQIVAAEIEYEMLSASQDPSNPVLKRLKQQIRVLNDQYTGMNAKTKAAERPGRDMFIPFNDLPEVGLKFYRLSRNVKVHEAIFEVLTQQFEQAKIQEAKDTPALQVIDKAVPPINRTKPKRRIMVVIAGIFSLMMSAAYIYAVEFVRTAQTQGAGTSAKISYILNTLVSDLRLKRKSE